ncbi:hypothetical protein V8E53_006090 [Lactarius tabidus]
MLRQKAAEERSFDDSLSQPHFPRVIATSMRSITRRIYHKVRNFQRYPISFNEKLRKRKDQKPNAIAQTLPDDVLLEIFKYHRLASLTSAPWKWYKLAQVCRRWRFVVFAYPRLLDLRIVSTNNNPIREIPDFWPAVLPLIMRYRSPSAEDEDNIYDMLKNPARICEMDIDITCSLLEKCAPLFEQSFPALEYLRLGLESRETVLGGRQALVFPDNFLGSSTLQLRVVRLQDTVFPTFPRLLSASENLVSLQLINIPASGILTAQDLALGLSSATQLESLKIDIYGALVPHSSIQNGLEPRTVLPALLEFQFAGESLYLNALASRIDTPIIKQIGATFFSGFDGYTDELCGLFARGEELRSSRCRKTHIQYFGQSTVFTHHFTRLPSSPGSFRVQVMDRGWPRDHVALVTQICRGFQSLGILHKVAQVEIDEHSYWPRVLITSLWLNLLRALSGVKRLHVVDTLVPNVVSTLAKVSGEETGEILPALRDLHLQGEPGTSAAIEPFITARKLYGLPISVHYRGLDWRDDCSGE